MKHDHKGETYKDPVCGLEVGRISAIAESQYHGKTYYFCAGVCKEVFDNNRNNILSVIRSVSIVYKCQGYKYMKPLLIVLMILGDVLASHVYAGVPRNLEYPTSIPNADEVARQVYFVNHFYAFSRFSIDRHPKGLAIIVNAAPGKRPRKLLIERHINNAIHDGIVKSREIAIVREGKDRSTGMLIVEYEDDNRPHDHYVWLPTLRKVKRFSQPAYAESWAGTHFTYGDLTLRKPEHETHKILGVTQFNACLQALRVPTPDVELARVLPEPSCQAKDRDVYLLKSSRRESGWWYDYRISYVDTLTYADYRTEFFKDGRKIKVIDRDWRTMGMEDPRVQYWSYAYVKDLRDQHESEIIVPRGTLKYDHDKDPGFWSLKTLRQLNR